MTLTYPTLEVAREIVWLVTGEEKRDVLARLLAQDTSIPAGRVANPNQLVVCDVAVAAELHLTGVARLRKTLRAVARSISTPSSRSFTAMRSLAECTSFVASTASISLIGKKPYATVPYASRR